MLPGPGLPVSRAVQKAAQTRTQRVRQIVTQRVRQTGTQEVRPAGTQKARQTGTQEVRQTGTQKARQTGTQEVRQIGTQEVRQIVTQEEGPESDRLSCHLARENEDSDFICSIKDTPIPAAPYLHNHDGYEIYLFLSGEIRLNFENESRRMERGDLVLIPPYVFHYAMPLGESTYRRIVINIKDSYPTRRGPDYAHFTDCFYQADSSRINVLRLSEAQMEQYCSCAVSLEQTLREPVSSYGRDFMAESLLTILLVLIGRIADASPRLQSRQTPPSAVAAAFRYVDDHLAEKLLLEDIAAQVHLHPVYLTRIFKAYTGIPVQQYIIEKRLSFAKKLLREGKPPMDVCFLCGFNNYSNFSRTFSRHLKLSPKQYQVSTRAFSAPRS